MGFLRKIGRKIGKGIRKLTKKIGPVGTFALYFMMPTIAHKFSNGLTTLSKLGNAADANILMKTAGKFADATHFVTDGIGSLHNGITSAMTNSLDAVTGKFDIGSKFSNFINDKRLDYSLDANKKWTEGIQTIINNKDTPENIVEKYKKLLPEDVEGSTRKDLEDKQSLLGTLGQAAGQQAVMSTTSAIINKEFEEDDTGAKGAVFGTRVEEGTGASRTPLPPPMKFLTANAGVSSINTWQQYFNSNLYGTGDPTWQAWHRLAKYAP